MADPQDLATLSFVTTQLAAGGLTPTAAQAAALPALITAASGAINRLCRRLFAVNTYDDVKAPNCGQPDKGEPDWIELTSFPIVPGSITRCATGRTAALTVSNTDPVTNARALVAFTVTGDPDICMTRTGLTLTRVASGVTSAATLTFATYPTVATLAAAINGLGNGWSAIVTDPYASWSSVDLYGSLGPATAIGSPGGVQLDVFMCDLAGYDVSLARGSVYLPSSRNLRVPAGGWFWPTAPEDETLFGGAGNRSSVRVTYQAGFSTIPYAIQEACAEAVKAALFRLKSDDALKSESAKDYSYTLRDVMPGLPAHVREALASYRAI